MKRRFVVDTGPLVAFLNRRDRHHSWAISQLAQIEPPLATCEAVVTEACHLLRSAPGGAGAVLELVHRGLLSLPFQLAAETDPVSRLMARYSNVPMSLADGCLVRLMELKAESTLLTLDSDFTVYRMHGRRVIPVLMPPRGERVDRISLAD